MSQIKFCALLFCLFFTQTYIFADEPFKSVKAKRTSTPVIDGIWSDAEWMEGGVAKEFTQYEPDEGKPSTQETEAYFLYDDENLYVGVKCFDTQKEKILNPISGRDHYEAADYIEIMLDTFNDDRNAYSFGTTPSGTKIDGKYSNDGQWDTNWDGIWYVEGSLTEFGWIAEFKIPFNTLTFPKEEINNWGMNIQRIIERQKENTFWQGFTRDEGFKVSNFGNIENIEGIKPGMNLQVLPYLTSGLKKDRISALESSNRNGFSGLDVRYGLTSNLTAVLTVNPDYAQIEADEDQINLSRYPYILREKRPFFLEGAPIFNTAGNAMSDGEYRTALFYSRRINEPVYGLKSAGKVGNWDVGLIHTLNENDLGLKNKIEDGELSANHTAQAYYNIVRMSHDVFERSQLGLIAMSKEYEGGFNRLVGLDGRLKFKNNYNISYELVKSFTPQYKTANHSANLFCSHYSDFFKFSIWLQEQAPNFMGNEIGFYDYNNFRNLGGWLQFAPRFEKYGIRRMGNNINFWGENFQTKNFFEKSTLSKDWNYNFWIQTMNYWMFGAGRGDGKYWDRFDDEFYPRLRYWIWMENNWSSPINFRFNHQQGKYRTGYSWSYYTSFRIRPNSRFNLELNQERSLAKLINQETGTIEDNYYQIWRSKFYYHFNRNLNARLIFQYNGMENRLDTYYLIAYNFKPGSFFYIAYTERFDSELYTNLHGLEITPKFGSSNKFLQIKLSYMFQI